MTLEQIKAFLLAADSIFGDISGGCDETYKVIARLDTAEIFQCGGAYSRFDSVMELAGQYYADSEIVDKVLYMYNKYNIDGKIGQLQASGEGRYVIWDHSAVSLISDGENEKVLSVEGYSDYSDVPESLTYTLLRRDGSWLISDIQGKGWNYEKGNLIKYVDAFSTDASSYIEGCSPENILDGDVETAWAEGAEGDGIGEWIKLNADEAYEISGIEITNGIGQDEDMFYAYNRVKQIRIEFSDQTSVVAELKDGAYGFYNYQRIELDKPVKTSSIKITILDIFQGKKYHDTCMADIIVSLA
jgi:hypothetical protein